MNDACVRTGWHWEFGWLRRKDLDDHNGYCYEEPDGDQVFFRDVSAKNMVLLDKRIDAKTGEWYLCMNKGTLPPDKVQRCGRLYIKFRIGKMAKR